MKPTMIMHFCLCFCVCTCMFVYLCVYVCMCVYANTNGFVIIVTIDVLLYQPTFICRPVTTIRLRSLFCDSTITPQPPSYIQLPAFRLLATQLSSGRLVDWSVNATNSETFNTRLSSTCHLKWVRIFCCLHVV